MTITKWDEKGKAPRIAFLLFIEVKLVCCCCSVEIHIGNYLGFHTYNQKNWKILLEIQYFFSYCNFSIAMFVPFLWNRTIVRVLLKACWTAFDVLTTQYFIFVNTFRESQLGPRTGISILKSFLCSSIANYSTIIRRCGNYLQRTEHKNGNRRNIFFLCSISFVNS